jgi:CRISPR/Cas system CSM-associated protein Csm3 (group 7 of RAMP superfamily)
MSTELKPGEKVTGKIIVFGKMLTTSSLLIGLGKGEEFDAEVIINEEGKPYIPASSFAGMFRHYFYNLIEVNEDECRYAELFFGSESQKNKNPDSYQSHFAIEDCLLANGSSISLRDGVRINPKTGTAEKKSKYIYQVLDEGAEFNFRAEITLRDNFPKDYFLEILKFLSDEGDNEKLRLGALTSFGFGKWKWQAYKVYLFRFPDQKEEWFKYQSSRFTDEILPKELELAGYTGLRKKDKRIFSICAEFEIKSSLIVGHYGINPNEPDKTHLKSKDKAVLPGKSIKGALRHRALKILQTLGMRPENADNFLNQLMGFVNESDEDNKQKSRLLVEETIIEGAEENISQPRNKIDRFTGGTMKGSLFESQPLFHQREKFCLKLSVDSYTESEAGLLLLLLKDLWTEDLPIGGEKNIGRGMLKGISAKISLHKDIPEKIEISNGDKEHLKISPARGQKTLEDCVGELNQLIDRN